MRLPLRLSRNLAFVWRLSARKVRRSPAKSAALKHAGLSASNVTFTKAKLDDGKYEIEFVSGSAEYEYEIDAATGSVLEYDVERSEPAPSNDNRQPDRDDDHDDHDDNHDDDRDDDHDDDDDDDDD